MKQLIIMPKNTGVVCICKLTNGQLIQRIVELIAIFSEAFLELRKKVPNNTLIQNIFSSMDKEIPNSFLKIILKIKGN